MEAAVERLLAIMDAMDGDPDFEPGHGASELLGVQGRPGQERWGESCTDDEREPPDDDEPSLCGIEVNSIFCGDGDFEAQCEDEGFESDREPDEDHLCNWQDEGDQSVLRRLPTR
jgi:hypothetical protein